jgi:hypothetical protein
MHTDIHVLSGIRSHDPSVRASEDIWCLRPRGHCDRQEDFTIAPKSCRSNSRVTFELKSDVSVTFPVFIIRVDMRSHNPLADIRTYKFVTALTFPCWCTAQQYSRTRLSFSTNSEGRGCVLCAELKEIQRAFRRALYILFAGRRLQILLVS